MCFSEPFWIDRAEVTNAQFAQFDGVAANASAWSDADRPRAQITWFEARYFCAKRGTRMPTEAEWEYAATGQLVLTLYNPSSGVSRVAFSSDGKHLAARNIDGTTRIYVLPYRA